MTLKNSSFTLPLVKISLPQTGKMKRNPMVSKQNLYNKKLSSSYFCRKLIENRFEEDPHIAVEILSWTSDPYLFYFCFYSADAICMEMGG
jgi:hypothetical protein